MEQVHFSRIGLQTLTKIERINLYHLRMLLRAPFETSFGRATHRECLLLEVYADGLIGYGECVADADPGYSYETVGTAGHVLRDYISPALIGQELADAEDFQRRVSPIRGHLMAKAGLEMALWDLQGKRQGCSLGSCWEVRERRWRWAFRWASSLPPKRWWMLFQGMCIKVIGESKSK